MFASELAISYDLSALIRKFDNVFFKDKCPVQVEIKKFEV